MVIVLIGPMGCGKTTIGKLLAKTNDWLFADGDDYHPKENVDKMAAGIPLSDADRKPWLERLAELACETLTGEKTLVLACSALKEEYRRTLGIDQQRVISVYLKGSQDLLAQRVTQRKHQYMDKGLLNSQFVTMEEPTNGIIIEISSSPESIVAEITNQLNNLTSITKR